jgi:hypothetical protein
MHGLIKMVHLRGGLKTLNLSLQGKVCMQVVHSPLFFIIIGRENRADLMGCLEFDLHPRFPFFDTVATKPPRRELNLGFENIL